MQKSALFKYCAPTAHSLSNLRRSQLFCRHYSHFNDPFEFRTKVVSGLPDQQGDPERFSAAAAAWGFPGGVPEGMENDAREYFSDCEHRQPPFETMIDEMRVACFGSDPTALLMWSHYADGLRGFCLVLDEEVLRAASPTAYFTAVEYLSAPTVVDSFVYAVATDQYEYSLDAIDAGDRLEAVTGKKDAFRRAYQESADEALETMHRIWRMIFAAKPLEWEYEQEKRMLRLADDAGEAPIFHTYPASALRGVIVGERMPDKYRRSLIKILGEVGYDGPISTALCIDSSYRLSIRPLAN